MRLSIRLGVASTLAIATTAVVGVLATTGLQHTGTDTDLAPAAATVPTPSHVVVVMEENHSYADIIGNTSQAPYMNQLAGQGALLTSSYGVTHPSQPNYMAIFSGSQQGVTSDNCPSTSSAANLATELEGAGKTFKGYAEGLPSSGSTACTSGEYVRRHAPWINFSNVPTADSQSFSSFPSSSNYSSLPTVSFVAPNLQDDMHDGTVASADTWLKNNISSYATWAQQNNSLLIVTWDEDDYTENNQIPTIVVGAGVKAGKYSETINHYNILSTIESMYGLTKLGSSASATPITDIFGSSTSTTPTSPAPTSSPTPTPTPSAPPTCSSWWFSC